MNARPPGDRITRGFKTQRFAWQRIPRVQYAPMRFGVGLKKVPDTF